MRISDWSSDVCSSDLYVGNVNTGELERFATVASGKESTAIGNGGNALEYASVAVGSSAYAGGEMAVSVGGNALGDSATVVGRNGFAGDYGTAMGKGAEASGYAAIAVGAGAVAQGGYSIALGGGFADRKSTRLNSSH